jgi:phosphoribosylformylglycinamidine synthase
VTAPVSLIVSAFSPVTDVRRSVTPQLGLEPARLYLLDPSGGRQRLGGSALVQVYAGQDSRVPDLEEPARLKGLFDLVQALIHAGKLLACHDRSDGGLVTTLLEMAFAGHCGIEVDIASLGGVAVAALFSEEAGVVLQVAENHVSELERLAEVHGLADCLYPLGCATAGDTIDVRNGAELLLRESRVALQRTWSETSSRIQALRDNPDCAQEEFEAITEADPGLSVKLSFDPDDDIAAPMIATGVRPRIAVLREQGVNGQVEMAAAFHRAGFAAVDVHMSDLASARVSLNDFHGLVACGGFSYGDVLGAGEGWAKSILFNTKLRDAFAQFFHRDDRFALGVCNGCQMLSNLRELIPGAAHWPHFVRNRSEQFEARLSLVRVEESPSILLAGMAGSHMPIAVAHGEGRAEFSDEAALHAALDTGTVALRFIDNELAVARQYPANPNGSPAGISGLCSLDGRVTIMMPHPERVFRTVQHSWAPGDWGEDGAWMRLFRNARRWLG